MKKSKKLLFILLISFSIPGLLFYSKGSQKESSPAEKETIVYIIPIKGTIDLGLSSFVERVIKEAKENGAEEIIFEIDTFGGRVDAATRIRDTILESGIHSTGFVNKRAISAGALIAIATDSIVMAPGSTIGAATPVAFSPAGSISPVGEKEISYVRKEFKATAERSGHPADLSEAMVDPEVEIPNVVKKGKLLTLTTEEALKLKLAAQKAMNIQQVIEVCGFKKVSVKEVSPSWSENIVRFITNPVVSGLLLTLGFLGIFFELQVPGWGLSGTFGVVCLALFFGGHLLAGLAQWMEIILFLAGIVLLAIEIFAIPGFGVTGIAGITLIILGIFLSLIGRPAPDVPILKSYYIVAAYTLLISLLATITCIILILKFIPSTRLWKNFESRLALKFRQEKVQGYSVAPVPPGIQEGTEGVAATVLRPVGKVQFGEEVCECISEGEYIKAGEKVKVVRIEGGRIFVSSSCREV